MPGWHEATKDLQQSGDIAMVGIVQEQHPDRARLFMQWKGMGWPVLVDRLNELEVAVVPITLLIDEHGVIRARVTRTRDPRGVVEKFLTKTYAPPVTQPPALDRSGANPPDPGADADTWRRRGAWLLKWGGVDAIDESVAAMDRSLKKSSDAGLAAFQRGVTYRARYDSPHRRPGDFQTAAAGWSAALEINPNQYIWRRRIQQYGPRLDKPYPFYDWVVEARDAIRARGGTPAKLVAEPTGAELARPIREMTVSADAGEAPDPQGRITRDEENLIAQETTVVPALIAPGQAVRAHLVFRPGARDGHWNNEAGPMKVWLDPPDGWQVSRRVVEVAPRAKTAVSVEPRTVEVEIRVPPDATPGTHVIPGYALYYACAGPEGTCVYRRRDLAVEITVQ